MIDYALVGKRLKDARKTIHLSQEQLAEKAEITVTYLSKIENGKVHPTMEVLQALCLNLNTDISVIIGNASSSTLNYQQDEFNQLFQSLSPTVKPIAINLLQELAKIK